MRRSASMISICSLLLSGCATTLGAAMDRPEPVEVSLQPSESGTRVSIKAKETNGDFKLYKGVGYAADALLMGDLANYSNTYGDTGEAIRIISAYALFGIGIDFLSGFLGGELNRPVPASLALNVKDEPGSLIQDLKMVSKGQYEAFVPFSSLSGLTVKNRYNVALAQKSPVLTAAIEKGAPPKLSTSIALEEPLGDRAIHAAEGGCLVIQVTNAGKGTAHSVSVRLSPAKNLSFPSCVLLGDIPPGASRKVSVPIEASVDLKDGNASILVSAEDRNQFDAPQARIAFQTLRRQPVSIAIEQVGIDDPDGTGIPRRGEQVDIQALVRNKGNIPARSVSATLLREHPGIVAGGPETVELGNIPAGGFSIATFSIFVKNSYDGPQTLPLRVRLSEKTTASDEKLRVVLEQSGSRIDDFSVAALDPFGKTLPELVIDVDKPLEKLAPTKPDSVAVVIGIERYNKRLPGVSFAGRDAAVVATYFTDLLGIPKENLVFLLNEEATKANIQVAIEEKIKRLISPGRSEILIYYAGHGAPDPQSGTPYLIPYDGDPNYPSVTCYATPMMYEALGKTGAKSTTVVLDACFSGQDGRSEKPVALLADARPLFLKELVPSIPPNVTLFAASGPNQLSSAFSEKRHGLFTYFLLKGLREGKTTVNALQGYLSEQVSRQARRLGREQLPVLIDGGKGDRSLVGKR